GDAPEYNNVDATLWYFEAIRAYHAATSDDALIKQLFPLLQDIIDWHVKGTRYGIRVEHESGLLHAGEPGVQLTWMDAKVGDWVVTPRTGKPVEIQALWYNALRITEALCRQTRQTARARDYAARAEQTRAAFEREFWNEAGGYL